VIFYIYMSTLEWPFKVFVQYLQEGMVYVQEESRGGAKREGRLASRGKTEGQREGGVYE
jgi:hypothetical protein